ncbi:aliphatic sulfonate ABC transporter permease SsuC [Paenactinomyces guangxiensis]|uniref:Aliphatic sulfonate ABC transporter permease SsuC n=1 Tax=Paenactinomyces guangxiensis TaxID=1490290 RepID=A0A7W2A896_9BACL|nr:aliphatic sulfonate ABC transporter permease SsuC [Paenactinomyces guangxiensis]MBA4493937.1 aliphatic sulfonate ABC transporter permease SsuC [Paenactinomyces guangxiensis]MBH8591404.1 aliphatic sulfonate ABC transporter permease SsuC [Paenactinomyces guangxiensis]
MIKDFPLHKIIDSLIPWSIPVLLVILWQILSQLGWISGETLPEPMAVILAAIQLTESGELFQHIGDSTYRALLGLLIGGGIGLVLGFLNGLFPVAEKLLDTTVQMLRNIPHLSLIPLAILWFGIGEEAKVFLVALGVFFPLYLNTFHGIRSVDSGLIEMGKVYRLNGGSLFIKVIFPGALPSILVGFRYSLGIMWLTLIVAETISSDSGIGYMAMNGREFMQMDVVLLSILLYALLGKLADILAKVLERQCLRWQINK